jgi:fructokinase
MTPTATRTKTAAAPRDIAIVGVGELLWDELPGGKRLGGAPANFAVMASRLGAHGIIASRLGDDAAGREARALLATLPADTRFLQTDPALPTGRVSVTLAHGQPEYVIHAPSAWDALALTPEWLELAARADAVCWGSLGQRQKASRETIEGFVAATRKECLRVFDVNLRQEFATAEAVRASLQQATLLKLNDGEMPLLCELAGLGAATAFAAESGAADARDDAFQRDAQRLLSAFPGLELVAITLGDAGSLLVSPEETIRHRGVATTVVDTVGAGDAFTAALVTHRLAGTSLAVQSEAANRWGAWVASQAGAMPALDADTYARIERTIESAG